MRATALRIDFVSDVTCPWCAIGLHALEQAVAKLGDGLPVELHLQPFELNPGMPRDGEPIADYAARKYGSSADALAQRQALIRQRAAEVGLALRVRTHVYNTFDAHRLLHWAALAGSALDLKRALRRAYHGRGENPALHDALPDLPDTGARSHTSNARLHSALKERPRQTGRTSALWRQGED